MSNQAPTNEVARTIEFSELVRIMGGAKPTFSRPIMGLGKRIIIPLVFNFDDKSVEFFCEAKILADRPENPALGFTPEDVTYFQGVTVYDVRLGDIDEETKYNGTVLSFEDFLAKYVDAAEVRAYLARKMDELQDAVMMDEEALESVNSLWMNREVGEKIIDVKMH